MEPEVLLSHADFVRGLAASLVYGAADVDDVVQETWLRALTHPPRPGPGIRSWLSTVLRNVVRKGRRGAGRRTAREMVAARPEGTATREILAREEIRREVIAAVLDLDEIYREVIALRYLDGHKPAVIAERLGLPIATVKTRLQRGLAKLRDRLDDNHDGDRRAWVVLLLPHADVRAAPARSARVSSRTAAWVGAGLVASIVSVALFLNLTGYENDPAGPPDQPDSRSTAGVADAGSSDGDEGRDGAGGVDTDGRGKTGGKDETRVLVGVEVEVEGKWRQTTEEMGEAVEQVIEFSNSEGRMWVNGSYSIPFTRLPNGDIHISDGQDLSMTYSPSLLGDVLTLSLRAFQAPPDLAGGSPPPAVEAVPNADGVDPTPTPVETEPDSETDLGGPPQQLVLVRIPSESGAGATFARLHQAYEMFSRGIPAGLGLSGADLLSMGPQMLSNRALREFARPDDLLASHLEFFEREENPDLRRLSRYTLVSSPEAMGMLLERRAWRQRSLQCRRAAARSLSVAKSITVAALADALGDPADPVVLFALMVKTFHTFGSPPKYLLTDDEQVPAEVTAHWRDWVQMEWPALAGKPDSERLQVETDELRALHESGDPMAQERCIERLSAFCAPAFERYVRFIKLYRDEGREKLERRLGKLDMERPDSWGHFEDYPGTEGYESRIAYSLTPHPEGRRITLMPSRVFNRTLLLVVAISFAAMLLLFLITGEEDVLFFFAGCAGMLLATFLVRLLLAPLFGLIKDRYH